MKRCATVSDGYAINFTERKAEEGKVFATFTACTPAARSSVSIAVTPSKDASAKRISVGAELLGAASALCKAGKTIVFDLQEDSLKLFCEEAVIPVRYKDQLMNFEMKSPKNHAHAAFKINTLEWKRMVQQGGFAHGEAGANPVLKNILLLPCVGGDNFGVRAASTNGHYATSGSALVSWQDGRFAEMAQAGTGVCIPPDASKLISAVLKGDSVGVYLFDNQLLIHDGNDFFAFALGAGNYPTGIFNALDEAAYSFSFKADVSVLKIAIDIVSANCANIYQAAMMLEVGGQGVSIRSPEGDKKSPVRAEEVEGSVSVCVPIKQLRDILSSGITETNTVTISGTKNVAPVHVRGGRCSAIVLPIAFPDSTESSPES